MAALCSIGIAIDSAEVLYSRHEYGPHGILSWEILKLDSRFLLSGTRAKLIRFVLGYPGYIWITGIQLFCSLIVVLDVLVDISTFVVSIALIVILKIKMMTHFRNIHGGLDGSDQMQVVILVSLVIVYVMPAQDARVIAFWFIAGQSMLSYVAAGVAKLVSPVWRSGDAVTGILATDNYGSKFLGSWFQNRGSLTIAVCWAVIVFECLGPFLVFLGPTPCLIFIGMGTFFHLSIACIMGLNNFVWSFGAAYPALLFVAHSVQSW